MKICFLGPSGYGKSTAVQILSIYYSTFNIKIGEPLYDLQKHFYEKIKTKLKGEQDGELLQFYGMKIRKENPQYLLEDFGARLANISSDIEIITNDDCRPYDYEYLKQLDFIFVKIDGYKRDRTDHSNANPNLKIEWQSEIPFDYILQNLTDLDTYKENILNLVKEIKNDRKVLYRTSPKKM
jgi:hypothetical protein